MDFQNKENSFDRDNFAASQQDIDKSTPEIINPEPAEFMAQKVVEKEPEALGFGSQNQPVVRPLETQPRTSIPVSIREADYAAGCEQFPAADRDVIESSWIDKTDEIIKKTVGNPRARTDGISAIRSRYIVKRLGKDR